MKSWELLCRYTTYLGIMSFPTTTEKTKSRAYFAAERLKKRGQSHVS